MAGERLKTKRPWTSASLLDGLGLPLEDIARIRPLLRPPRQFQRAQSIEAMAESQRGHLRRLWEQLTSAVNESKNPRKRARHQNDCKRAVLVFFHYISGGREACSWDECAAVAEPNFRFSCPIPAQADAASDNTRSGIGVGCLRDAKTFPARLRGLIVASIARALGDQRGAAAEAETRMEPSVLTTFEVTDMVLEGLSLMCRFDVMVRIRSGGALVPLVHSTGMAKGCFSMDCKLLCLDVRFDVFGLQRDIGAALRMSLLPAIATANACPAGAICSARPIDAAVHTVAPLDLPPAPFTVAISARDPNSALPSMALLQSSLRATPLAAAISRGLSMPPRGDPPRGDPPDDARRVPLL